MGVSQFEGTMQPGAADGERAGQDFGQERQRVDAGVEDPEATGLPDPRLVRVPAAHVLLPDDGDRAGGAFGEPRLGLGDGGREAGMPGREEHGILGARGLDHQLDLAQRRGRGLFQQHVAAGVERPERHRGADVGRHAERHHRGRAVGEEAVEVGEVGHAVDRRVTRDAGDEGKVGVGGDRRDMLVAGDLADADQGNGIGRGHAGRPCVGWERAVMMPRSSARPLSRPIAG